ncbi:MAG: HAD family phosphatase [Caldilinea sp.]|nr:HAD family phosphatase [Caldilinea sp.]MDW8440974.1 HAD family phosphatase [Caldilineaceae bacterium]
MNSILFDLGNVLVRYDHGRTLSALAALYGVDAEEIFYLYQEIAPAFGIGQIAPEEVVRRFNERFGAKCKLEQFADAFCCGLGRDDAALAYAVSLRQEGELAIGAISNTNAIHVAWLDDHAPELKEFDLVMMSNEVGMCKPAPEIFELAMELLNVPAQRILYIDDLEENVEAARKLGMAGVVHSDWAKTRQQIEAWRAERRRNAYPQ